MKRIIDISLPLSADLPAWPNSPGFELTQVATFERDGYNETMIRMGAHFGTHIDAPRHFTEDGATIDDLLLEQLNGGVFVASLKGVNAITAEILEKLALADGVQRLLFKTSNSALWAAGKMCFEKDYVALTRDGAEWLVSKGIELVGIDYLSIQRYHDSNETHRILLGHGVVIVEGLDLSAVEQGHYDLLCLPLLVSGAEGAPARVALRCSI